MEELDDDNWTYAELLDEDEVPTLLRIRDIKPVKGQCERLDILWEYEPVGEERMPAEHELARMNECERLLTQFEFDSGSCSLVGVVTSDGIRHWIVYSSKVDEFGSFANQAFPADPPFPIEIEFETDSDWSQYFELVELLNS